MDTTPILTSIIAGYFMGNLMASYLITKWVMGFDIREHGTGNAGGSNSFMIMGWKNGLIVGIIDILATDKKNKNHVVIELKRNQTNDEVLGQIKKYMGWVKVHKKDNNVIGIVVAKQFDKKFYYAMQMEKDVYPLEYEVDFKLKEFKKWKNF